MQLNHRNGEVGPRRMLRRLGAIVVTLAFLVPAATASADSSQTSQDVANEIVRLQSKADRTAGALAQAEIVHEDLNAQIITAQTQVEAKSAQFGQLQDQLATIAINRFMSGSGSSGGLLFGSPIEQLQTDALSAAAYDAGATSLDEVETAQAELVAAQNTLQSLQSENERLVTSMAEQQDQIAGQLAQLEALKATLVDAEAKAAYATAVAKQKAKDERARADAQAKAAKASAALTADQTGAVSATSPNAKPTIAATRNPGANSSTGAPAAPLLPSAPAPSVATPTASPDDSTTGDSSSDRAVWDAAVAAAAAAEPDPVVSVASFVCPVAGPNAFGDTWGAARSGGRRHEGTDLMSPFGTPLVAVVAGYANFKTNGLGGNVISLAGNDGNRYYYAHLSAWEGGSRVVAQGEVIGYVGHTGDTTANHLHFGIYPGGGAAVNPYATVRRYC